MRFIVLVKANADSEAGKMPSREELDEMGKFNETLVEAGIMLGGEGLHPSATGVRIRFDGAQPAVRSGPFAPPDELVAGFWLIQAPSQDEAIAWMKRAPFRHGEIEIRQLLETEDFGDALSPEAREREERLRTQLSG